MIDVISSDQETGNNGSASLQLRLHIVDPIVVRYLANFDPEQREEKAVEALRVGVIALRSASPTLDTGIVEAKFRELESTLDGFAREFGGELKSQVERYFKDETGALPRQLDGLTGENGSLRKILEDYFASDRGRLTALLQDRIGPQSDFGRQVDPNNTEGLIHRIQHAVESKLEAASSAVLQEFSLDAEGSALSRLRRELNHQVEEVKGENARFFAELKEHLGIQAARDDEAAQGTQKGRDFEALLYDRVAEIGQSLGDITENVTATPGYISRCKTGDYVCALGSDSGAPGKRIVIEAKNRADYTLRSAVEELKEAKQNRGASLAIMVFSDECCPPEIDGFRIVDRDLFLSVDADSLVSGAPTVFLESAYRIARAMLVAEQSQQFATKFDVGRIARALKAIQTSCEKFAEIRKKASSVRLSAQAIEQLADEVRPEIECGLREIELIIKADAPENSNNPDVITMY